MIFNYTVDKTELEYIYNTTNEEDRQFNVVSSKSGTINIYNKYFPETLLQSNEIDIGRNVITIDDRLSPGEYIINLEFNLEDNDLVINEEGKFVSVLKFMNDINDNRLYKSIDGRIYFILYSSSEGILNITRGDTTVEGPFTINKGNNKLYILKELNLMGDEIIRLNFIPNDIISYEIPDNLYMRTFNEVIEGFNILRVELSNNIIYNKIDSIFNVKQYYREVKNGLADLWFVVECNTKGRLEILRENNNRDILLKEISIDEGGDKVFNIDNVLNEFSYEYKLRLIPNDDLIFNESELYNLNITGENYNVSLIDEFEIIPIKTIRLRIRGVDEGGEETEKVIPRFELLRFNVQSEEGNFYKINELPFWYIIESEDRGRLNIYISEYLEENWEYITTSDLNEGRNILNLERELESGRYNIKLEYENIIENENRYIIPDPIIITLNVLTELESTEIGKINISLIYPTTRFTMESGGSFNLNVISSEACILKLGIYEDYVINSKDPFNNKRLESYFYLLEGSNNIIYNPELLSNEGENLGWIPEIYWIRTEVIPLDSINYMQASSVLGYWNIIDSVPRITVNKANVDYRIEDTIFYESNDEDAFITIKPYVSTSGTLYLFRNNMLQETYLLNKGLNEINYSTSGLSLGYHELYALFIPLNKNNYNDIEYRIDIKLNIINESSAIVIYDRIVLLKYNVINSKFDSNIIFNIGFNHVGRYEFTLLATQNGAVIDKIYEVDINEIGNYKVFINISEYFGTNGYDFFVNKNIGDLITLKNKLTYETLDISGNVEINTIIETTYAKVIRGDTLFNVRIQNSKNINEDNEFEILKSTNNNLEVYVSQEGILNMNMNSVTIQRPLQSGFNVVVINSEDFSGVSEISNGRYILNLIFNPIDDIKYLIPNEIGISTVILNESDKIPINITFNDLGIISQVRRIGSNILASLISDGTCLMTLQFYNSVNEIEGFIGELKRMEQSFNIKRGLNNISIRSNGLTAKNNIISSIEDYFCKIIVNPLKPLYYESQLYNYNDPTLLDPNDKIKIQVEKGEVEFNINSFNRATYIGDYESATSFDFEIQTTGIMSIFELTESDPVLLTTQTISNVGNNNINLVPVNTSLLIGIRNLRFTFFPNDTLNYIYKGYNAGPIRYIINKPNTLEKLIVSKGNNRPRYDMRTIVEDEINNTININLVSTTDPEGIWTFDYNLSENIIINIESLINSELRISNNFGVPEVITTIIKNGSYVLNLNSGLINGITPISYREILISYIPSNINYRRINLRIPIRINKDVITFTLNNNNIITRYEDLTTLNINVSQPGKLTISNNIETDLNLSSGSNNVSFIPKNKNLNSGVYNIILSFVPNDTINYSNPQNITATLRVNRSPLLFSLNVTEATTLIDNQFSFIITVEYPGRLFVSNNIINGDVVIPGNNTISFVPSLKGLLVGIYNLAVSYIPDSGSFNTNNYTVPDAIKLVLTVISSGSTNPDNFVTFFIR